MGSFSKMIQADWILVDLAATRKVEVIEALVHALEKSGHVLDHGQLLADVMAREALANTALGEGCAVPHAHSPGMAQTLVAAARLNPPLDFQAPDGQPVSLVFLMAGPAKDTGLHLKVLSKLARLLHNGDVRKGILTAPDAQAFHACLCAGDD